jgi:hypothetical protein
LQPTFTRIAVYFCVKYFAFYIFLAFKNNNFFFLEISNMSHFMYWWMLLFLPFTAFVIFSLPVYLLFRLKRLSLFNFSILLFLVAEYFLYTYLASQADLMNGVYNEIISLLFFVLLFFKQIKSTVNGSHKEGCS